MPRFTAHFHVAPNPLLLPLRVPAPLAPVPIAFDNHHNLEPESQQAIEVPSVENNFDPSADTLKDDPLEQIYGGPRSNDDDTLAQLADITVTDTNGADLEVPIIPAQADMVPSYQAHSETNDQYIDVPILQAAGVSHGFPSSPAVGVQHGSPSSRAMGSTSHDVDMSSEPIQQPLGDSQVDQSSLMSEPLQLHVVTLPSGPRATSVSPDRIPRSRRPPERFGDWVYPNRPSLYAGMARTH